MQQAPAQTAQPVAGGKVGKAMVGEEPSKKAWLKWVIIAVVIIAVGVGIYFLL